MRVIQKLKEPVVLRPKRIIKATPCATEVSNLFNCWRNGKIDAESCAVLAAQLTACMASKKRTNTKETAEEINTWLRKSFTGKQL
ncbi:hypothetical protein HDV01_007700 [Terramyces sp. JEL0728]|nr:hypothetical protein HDV01_007700 [Terramyces sp. JEL0728]